MKAQNDKYKKDIAGTKQRLEKSEAAQADYKDRLETTSKELKGIQAEWKENRRTPCYCIKSTCSCPSSGKGHCGRVSEPCKNLFTVVAIGEQEVQEIFQSVYPPIETDSTVRILDRRDVGKKKLSFGVTGTEGSYYYLCPKWRDG